MEITDESDIEELSTSPTRPSARGNCPTTSKAMSSCDVGVQCKAKTAEQPSPPMETTTSANPSLSESDESENITDNDLQQRQLILDLIHNNPKGYLGIPKQYLWSLKYISEQHANGISKLALITTLFKIKQNHSMAQISDQFQIPTSDLTEMFVKGIECLANFYQNLIYLPSHELIKMHLPDKFKIRFSNVQCILHCLEIEIEKPSDAMLQAQTWSKDKSGSTLKYLIGCTPNGFITFISEGYGGHISNRNILERCKLIDILPVNAVVMADWGFEGVGTHLLTKGVKLIRPQRPGDYCTRSPKDQVALTKIIPTLRAHVNRVNKRLRQFQMLYPLSEFKYRHIMYMDQIVIIACGLINLQAMTKK